MTDKVQTDLSDKTDRAYFPILHGIELRRVQQRMLAALLRQPGLVPTVLTTGIRPEDFPEEWSNAFVVATKEPGRGKKIVADPNGDLTIRHLYMQVALLGHGQARQMAKQIVASVRSAQRQDGQSTTASLTKSAAVHVKTFTNDIEPRPGAQDKPNPSNVKYKEQLREGLVTVLAADIAPKRVDAIWMDKKGGVRLARGEHTVYAGEPGLGKSQVVMAMAAAVSTGGHFPCGEGRAPLGNVIILAAEDSIEHTLNPRLIAAGADLSRIHFVQAVAMNGGERRLFNFQSDFAKLEQLVKATQDVVLVIIDPVTAYMGKIDSHKNAEVRGVLAPLGELARECNVAIASVTHFTKGTGASTKAIDRIIGSIAFIAAPRIGFTVIEDPDDKDRRLLLHVKNNISRPPLGLAFRMEQRVVGSDEKGDLIGSCVAWETTPIEKSADDVLGVNGNKEPTAKTERIEFLETLLAPGPQKVSEIETEARDAGLLGKGQPIGQSKPFRAAREALGIKPYQPKGQKRAGWFWALPEHQMPLDGSDALQSYGASDGQEGI